MDHKIRINRIVKRTRVEGFGKRYCIWVQGCSIRCPNCKNRNMWSFDGGEVLEIGSLIQDIETQEGIEGITLLGGEPLDQRRAVSILLKAMKEKELSTIVFTGYVYEDLVNESELSIRQILKYTDLLIDGSFKQEELDFSRPWVGSKNQRYLFLSSRYKETDLWNRRYKNRYELRIYPDGRILVNGMGDLTQFDRILKFNTKEDA